MALETKVYFNADSKSKNKLNINIKASQSYPFFYGPRLNLFVKRIHEKSIKPF